MISYATTRQSIKEFQNLFEKEYGKKLMWDEASDKANNLMASMQKLMNDDTNEEITGERRES